METIKNIDAFPCDNKSDGYRGMTLRDYFANSAMQGIVGNSNKDTIINLASLENPYKYVAEQCYELADAMLRERNK